MNKRELLSYIGDETQMFGLKEYTLNGGKADGVKAIDVNNGSGLQFTVLPDRCLDISHLSYKGTNLSYISKCGIVAPQYYDPKGAEFLRSFFAGFLTTCGLRNVGSSCVDNKEELGLHGRISNTPAEQVSVATEWKDDVVQLKIKGKIREARIFQENLVLTREINVNYGENKIYINDSVENYGFAPEPLMLLYHYNLGYPLLSEDSLFSAPTLKTTPINAIAEAGKDAYSKCQKPTPHYQEQVFYHDLKADENGNTYAALLNPVIDLGVIIKFNKNELNNLTQWKQMGEGDYVMGIEPCNCHVGGRANERNSGTLQEIQPGEIKHFSIEIEIIEGVKEYLKV